MTKTGRFTARLLKDLRMVADACGEAVGLRPNGRTAWLGDPSNGELGSPFLCANHDALRGWAATKRPASVFNHLSDGIFPADSSDASMAAAASCGEVWSVCMTISAFSGSS